MIFEKNKLRHRILSNRKSLTEKYIINAESNMLKFIKNFDIFENANSVHTYISKKNEPRTKRIIKLCWELSKNVNVPYVIPGQNKLFHSELNSFSDLRIGSFGVLEPSSKKNISSQKKSFDLVIVPGVAFDMNGSRIGYGKGYYDRFLKNINAFRLALAFDFQVLEKIPTENHDIPINGIITESRKIIF
tara:strand:- start:1637 stop:2203 length:567 start_codon:yes stop_codon:yes gene_type:complete